MAIYPDKHVFVDTVDPTVDDDDAHGYVRTHRWINTTTDREFVCVDATDGAAVWISGTPQPLLIGDGIFPVLDIAAFQGQAALDKDDAFFIRVILRKGTYDRIECSIITAVSGKVIDMGLYADDGAYPTPSPTGAPLATTGPVALSSGDGNSFFRQPFTAPYAVPSQHYYWLAILANHPLVMNTTSHQYPKQWRNRLYAEESDHGSPLSTVGTLMAARDSAVPYMAILLDTA